VRGPYIYLRDKANCEVRVVSLANGQSIPPVVKFDEIRMDSLKCLDRDKFLVYDYVNKLTLFNEKGEIIAENQFTIEPSFNNFKLSFSGHFAFINYEQQHVYIV
jgi:hypothetical protein